MMIYEYGESKGRGNENCHANWRYTELMNFLVVICELIIVQGF